MNPLRRRPTSAGRPSTEPINEPTNEPTNESTNDSAADAAIVRRFADAVTAACIDLIDMPLDLEAQRRVVEVLLHEAPTAERAITRLNNSVVPS